jgi:hypothetical protein
VGHFAKSTTKVSLEIVLPSAKAVPFLNFLKLISRPLSHETMVGFLLGTSIYCSFSGIGTMMNSLMLRDKTISSSSFDF